MDEQSSRRFFLHKAASSIGLVLSAPVIAALVSACETDETPMAPPPVGTTYTVDVHSIPELAAVGGITLTFVDELNGGSPVFISRISESSFAVFTSTCTHAGCEVGLPAASGENCVCPCHRAEYSPANGAVVRQPLSGRAIDLPRFVSSYNSATKILTITA